MTPSLVVHLPPVRPPRCRKSLASSGEAERDTSKKRHRLFLDPLPQRGGNPLQPLVNPDRPPVGPTPRCPRQVGKGQVTSHGTDVRVGLEQEAAVLENSVGKASLGTPHQFDIPRRCRGSRMVSSQIAAGATVETEKCPFRSGIGLGQPRLNAA